jgi:hypothetical protein
MPRVDTGLPHQLAYRQRFSRGCRLLGCAIFLAGGMLAASPLLLADAEALSQAARTAAVFGALLASLGLLLLLGRRGKLFDKEERTVAFWWGVGWRWHEEVYDLRPFTQLVVRPAGEFAASWQISLADHVGEQLPLFHLPSEAITRVAATELASFLALPIVLAPPEPPSSEGPTAAATASEPAASATAVQAVPPVAPAATAPPERAAAP